MGDKFNDNSAVKGCWSKYKMKIDNDSIQTKVPVNMDRKVCKTKINDSMEKRASTIENVYDCSNDYQCDSTQQEINAIDYPDSEEEPSILICGIDLVINDQLMNSSLITSDESMVISPNTSINESWNDRRNQVKHRRRDRKLGLSDVSTPKWQHIQGESSLLTSDMSQETKKSTISESSDSLPSESEGILERSMSETMETSTPDRPSGPLLEEKSQEILDASDGDELSWSENSQTRLLESERQSKIYMKYTPLEPLIESPKSSWGEIEQRRLLESEMTGKGYRQHSKIKLSTPDRPSGPLFEERSASAPTKNNQRSVLSFNKSDTSDQQIAKSKESGQV